MQANAKVMHNGIKICAEKVQSRKFLGKRIPAHFRIPVEYRSDVTADRDRERRMIMSDGAMIVMIFAIIIFVPLICIFAI